MGATIRGRGRGEDGIPQRFRSGRPSGTLAEQDAVMVAVASRHPFMLLQDMAAAAGVGDIQSLVVYAYAPEESWAADV